MAKGKGGRALPLLVLLGLLVGAGSWNYKRNTDIEEAQYRPFRTYRDADLETLLGAYEGELDQRAGRYRVVASQKVEVRGNGLIGEQVQEFERVQRISRSKRAMAGKVAETQVAVEQAATEMAWRKRNRPIYKLYLRRILTF